MDLALQILKRVRRIELKARSQASGALSGQYLSSFRGQGLDFDDFREYLPGDEPRFIDWKVTARTGSPHVRKFREDREMCVLLVIDSTPSMEFGSQNAPAKREYAAELAAALAFSAQRNGDRIGLLLNGNKPGIFLPPEKGGRQVLRIVREILANPPIPGPFNWDLLSDFLLKTQKKRALVIFIGDLDDAPEKKFLGKIAFRHEILTFRVLDPLEFDPLPDAGLITLKDIESGELREIDFSEPKNRETYSTAAFQQQQRWNKILKELSIDSVTLKTTEDYLPKIHTLFQRRTRRHTI